MKYEITKEQVLENYKYALNNQDYLSARNLKEWFPNAFKKELEVGRWYKSIKRNFLVNYQGDNMENYGFWENQGFKNNIAFGGYWKDECIEATPQEVETALIAEAKKRGFKEGYILFNSGKWAEIIPQEKTIVPMENALKIIAKKMKVSLENIEIQ